MQLIAETAEKPKSTERCNPRKAVVNLSTTQTSSEKTVIGIDLYNQCLTGGGGENSELNKR